MDLSEFTSNYAHLSDDELLRLWAERSSLVPGAATALDSEIQRRGLKKENATRIKKRLDELAAREAKWPLLNQVTAAQYERNMRHFVGWEEPKFYSPYPSRDIRNTFGYIRYKYKVWKTFRDHTGHWPAFSIWFHFLSWLVVVGVALFAFTWVHERHWGSGWTVIVVIACVLSLVGARNYGARLARKLDWKRYGT